MKAIDFDFEAVRIIGKVPCGKPKHSFNDIPIEERELFYKYFLLHPLKTLAFAVEGDSMIGANIHSGDVVFVDTRITEPEMLSNHIVLVCVNNCLTIKRLRVFRDKQKTRYELHPENPNYKVVVLTEHDEWHIEGLVAAITKPI